MLITFLKWVHRVLQVLFFPVLVWSGVAIPFLLFDESGWGPLAAVVLAIYSLPYLTISFFLIKYFNKKYPENKSHIFYKVIPLTYVLLILLGQFVLGVLGRLIEVPDSIGQLQSDGEFLLFITIPVLIFLTSPYSERRYSQNFSIRNLVRDILLALIPFTIIFVVFGESELFWRIFFWL